jgi:hypothetical protein
MRSAKARHIEGARRRTDRARHEDVSGHDANLAASSDGRGNDTRAVGAYQTRLGLTAKDLGNLRT